jgi:uncharacterized membrane protein YccC
MYTFAWQNTPLAYLAPYKRLNTLLQNESLEPMISWGVRMGISGTAPVIWGLATGRVSDAVWMTVTAEAVTWVELKGAFTWRLRVLVAATALAVGAAVLGSLTGHSLLLSCLCMFIVGFGSTMLKNIGDRASGLAIAFYLMFIICNAFPVCEAAAVQQRVLLIGAGGLWALVVGVVASAFMREQEPFRRHIAIIWRTIAALADAVSKSDNRPGYTGMLAQVYAREKDVRAAINSSFEFYSQTAQQTSTRDNRQYQLAQLRKVAGLVAVNVIAMGDEMEHISVHELDKALRAKAAALFGALREVSERLSAYTVTLNIEERLLVQSQINRMRKLTGLIRDYPMPPGVRQAAAIARILQLTERTANLLDNALLRMEQMGADKPVYRSYSMIKTAFILRPRFLWDNLRAMLHMNTFAFKFAMRSAIAATMALFIYKWYNIDHGFWLPFSVMIVIQPYFGATFKKARDRITGTLLGVLAGSLLLYLPQGYLLQEAVLFVTFIMMVYYVKKKYAYSAFFITLSLVLLFNIESTYSTTLMATRIVATIGGSLLAVAAGWLLLPTWDKKLLPAYMARAIAANCEYFTATFFRPEEHSNWTRYKRVAESDNSNVYDSFSRYLQEPGGEKKEAWYSLITYGVRITRNLNNIHMEQGEKRLEDPGAVSDLQREKIEEALKLFKQLLEEARKLKPGAVKGIHLPDDAGKATLVMNHNQSFLLEKIIIEARAMLDDLAKI